MITLNLKSDPKAAALYNRNIEAIRRHVPDIADRLQALEEPVSKVVQTDDGDMNLDIGHTLFYEKGVGKFVDEQYEGYLKEPYRIDVGWPIPDSDPPQIMTKVAIRRLTQLAKANGIERMPGGKQRGVTGFAVSLGVGIGDHIGRLLRDHDAQSLIVVEQFIEFMWHSLHLNPWHEWIDIVEKRNGRVFMIFDDNPASASSELTDALRSDNGGTLDGTLIYTHYRSHLVREIHRGLSDQISYIGSNRGFFEDENIMIMNASRNFLAREHAVWRSRPRREKTCPAFVVAAGPSVDMAIDTIREYKDRAVIISCGSGLKVLLSQGIRPDFHVEVENTFGQADILEKVASQHDLSGITLVAAATVNPRTAAVFDRVIFFHRDTVCSTRFFELDGHPVFLAVPTVSNGGLRFALGMAFKEVYLFGVDLGTRIPDYHHSKASAYYTDEEFMFSFQGTKESTIMPFTTEGNLGGTVMTNDGFLLSRLFMQKLARAYAGYTVYNCSDGVDIPFTVPKLPAKAKSAASPKDRANAIDLVFREVEHYAQGECIDLARYRELREKTIAWYEDAHVVIDRLAEDETPDVFKAYDRLWKLFQPPTEAEFDPIDAVVWQNNFGTVMTLYNVYFRMHRRVADTDAPRVYQLFLSELRCFLKDMEAILLSVIDLLMEETEQVKAEQSLSA
ncbi:MAG: 6-hydroxymethylpterin diphosphokinase MptE-like protein [Alphaproteobacteria bacterium]|nr:6-hydroxymethylpterin diphosphokinase MptE-like protein [Alphaproteobacteria bacterium]